MTESDSGPETAKSTEKSGRPGAPPAAGFWAFSLTLYDRPGAAQACLGLQDGFDADVNLLLLGFWRARRGYAGWADAELDRVEAAVAPVNAVLKPLRQARRSLKDLIAAEPTADALYAEIKALELKLEQVAQVWLAAASRIGPAQPDDQQALQLGADLLRIAFS